VSIAPSRTSAARRVAFLIAGSRTPAFYSQIAALSLALDRLPWQRWQPSVHAFLGDGGEQDGAEWERWATWLTRITLVDVSAPGGNWAQVDATIEMAPSDADVLVSLDADTFPVGGFEDVLDAVADEDLVAGVMAHYPPPAVTTAQDWARIAEGVLRTPLVLSERYSLLEPATGPEACRAPFYVNGGVVFYARGAFSRFAPRYLALRHRVAACLADEAFSGQVASTLAIAELDLRTRVLPIRYNFPNDPVAERLYPLDARNVVIHHYLRTAHLDRQRIFTSRVTFEAFASLSLEGPDQRFQTDVCRAFEFRYPFD
jgi:hypothetical protein